jgi:CubicO group peptidase (beta-lactamase class C family)
MNAPHPNVDPHTLGLSVDRLQRIAAALNAEIAAGTLPGAVLAIARHGKVGYFETFGHLDPGARVPMTGDAIFSIASMTKPLVTVGALMLYEEGRMMVNEPVEKYLPRLAGMRVADPQCDGSAASTIAAVREMTIQDLMRHTSGLAYGRAGVMSTPGEFHWAGSTGTYFWVDPAEELAAVFMAHAPGAIRYYHRQLLHALVNQALD